MSCADAICYAASLIDAAMPLPPTFSAITLPRQMGATPFSYADAIIVLVTRYDVIRYYVLMLLLICLRLFFADALMPPRHFRCADDTPFRHAMPAPMPLDACPFMPLRCLLR